MSMQPPAPLATGHPEIDREHAVLLELLKKLENVCVLPAKPSAACAGCTHAQRLACDFSLVDVLGSVLGFTVDHFAFEEKAMRWLPDSIERSAHCGAHIDDHERISRELRDLALSIDSPDIIRSGVELQVIIRQWIGEHIVNFDVPLVSLMNSGSKPAQSSASAASWIGRFLHRVPLPG